MKTKSVYQSKINGIGAALVLLGLFEEPSFKELLGQLVPQAWMPNILAGAGLLLIIVRTLFTYQPIWPITQQGNHKPLR